MVRLCGKRCCYSQPSALARLLLRFEHAGLRVVESSPEHTLYPADQQQNDHNDEDQTQPATREVTPGTAVIPRRESTYQKQNQQNDQNSSKHTFLLISKKSKRVERGNTESRTSPNHSLISSSSKSEQ